MIPLGFPQLRKKKTNVSASPPASDGLLSTIAQGAAFGVGSSLAHKGVDSIFKNEKEEGKSESEFNEKEQLQYCKLVFKQYRMCLENQSVNDPYACQGFDADFRKCMEYL